jgi:hypothetical protein
MIAGRTQSPATLHSRLQECIFLKSSLHSVLFAIPRGLALNSARS